MRNLLFILLAFSMSLTCWAQQTVTHSVLPGETIESISELYGISKSDLIEANPSVTNYIYVGQTLMIPNRNIETSSIDVQKNTVNQSETINKQEKSDDHTAFFGIDNSKHLFNYGMEFCYYKPDGSHGILADGGIVFGYEWAEHGKAWSFMTAIANPIGIYLGTEYVYFKPSIGIGYLSYGYGGQSKGGVYCHIHPTLTINFGKYGISLGYFKPAYKFKFNGNGCFSIGLSILWL